MTETVCKAPDTLVLAGGGTLGEAWMTGVAIGIKRGGGPDLTMAGHFIGTSAGAIMASMIVGETSLEYRMQKLTGDPDVAHVDVAPTYSRLGREPRAIGRFFSGILARFGLTVLGPGSKFLRRAFLRRVPEGKQNLDRLGRSIEQLGISWNGRLRITAVDQESSDRVVFGCQYTDTVSVSDAVIASCAIPGYFKPIAGGGRSFVDGGVWSFSNLDLAGSGKGRTVICLSPAGTRVEGVPRLRGAITAAGIRLFSWLEAASLRRDGTRVTVIRPNAEAAVAIGPSRMDSARIEATVAAGIAQGLGLAEVLSQRFRPDDIQDLI